MTKLASRERFLEIYAGVLTAVFAITVFGGFAESRKTAFDEIDVDRINIVEPDGTLQGRDRLVNSRWQPTAHRAFSFSTRAAEW